VTDSKAPEAPDPSTVSSDEFAKLLAATRPVEIFTKGASVKGTIVQIGETDVLVDIGGRSEATIARAELQNAKGELTSKVGDAIEATVVAAEGGVRLSRKLTAGSQAREMLMEAWKSHIPVQGRVTASVKGGYEVQVAGVRGFCPFSQIDTRRQEDPTLYFNKTFDFQIKEYHPSRRNLILSRRALLEKEIKKQEAEARAQIVEGAVQRGTVVSLQDFGAFVDLGGGIQGLLHVSEMSHARVAHPKDLLAVGQEVEVQVLKLDRKKNKISLTRKPLESDPWSGVDRKFHAGQIQTAKVVRTAEFGAFVELAPGVDGLVHISELQGRKVEAGSELKVQIIKVEPSRRRISLGVASDGAEAGSRVEVKPVRVGDTVTGKVEKVEKFGVFLRIGPGRTGVIPNKELGTPRGADHRKMFAPGTEMTAEVIEADPAGRRIRLSVTKVAHREEREAIERYRKDVTRSTGGSFSTLADAFKAIKPRSGDSEPE
jgi:small subunit ribosomal protein S1